MSEHRVYVSRGEIADIGHYEGDEEITLALGVVEVAIALLDRESPARAGYTIDFGVLDTGETALVELNDGWAIGLYDGVSRKAYFNVLAARWAQLVAARPPVTNASALLG